MEAAAVLKHDGENESLKGLIDAFGAKFSHIDIENAYCKAGRNAPLAVDILTGTESPTFGSVSCDGASAGAMSNKEALQRSYGSSLKHPGQQSGNFGKFTPPKQKWVRVSAGTVSSVLGKDYVKPVPSANGPIPRAKPLKLDSKELPMNVIWVERTNSTSFKKEKQMHKDMEDFLFKMLGDGFQLGRDVIKQVLDSCGYDIQKSMNKLLVDAAINMSTKNQFCGESTNQVNGMRSTLNRAPMDANISKGITSGESPIQEEKKYDLQEVLNALFRSTDSEGDSLADIPRRTEPQIRSKALGKPVCEPFTDFTTERRNGFTPSEQDIKYDEEEERGFQTLRGAVKEYHNTMKEYYKSAVEAFAKGDVDRAYKLLEQGQFFRDKARDADEESSKKIFETSSRNAAENKNEMPLELHSCGAAEAISLLKRYLSWFAGTYKHLRVVLESGKEDDCKLAQRRRIQVLKLLERESVSWAEEEGCPGTILVRLDIINLKCLSFSKKYNNA